MLTIDALAVFSLLCALIGGTTLLAVRREALREVGPYVALAAGAVVLSTDHLLRFASSCDCGVPQAAWIASACFLGGVSWRLVQDRPAR